MKTFAIWCGKPRVSDFVRSATRLDWRDFLRVGVSGLEDCQLWFRFGRKKDGDFGRIRVWFAAASQDSIFGGNAGDLENFRFFLRKRLVIWKIEFSVVFQESILGKKSPEILKVRVFFAVSRNLYILDRRTRSSSKDKILVGNLNFVPNLERQIWKFRVFR